MFTGYDVIKDMIQDAGEQPDEEVQGTSLGGSPVQKLSVSVKLGCITLLAHRPWTPYYWDFMEASSCRDGHYYLHLQPLPLS